MPEAWKQFKYQWFFDDFQIDRRLHYVAPQSFWIPPGGSLEPPWAAPATSQHSKAPSEVTQSAPGAQAMHLEGRWG